MTVVEHLQFHAALRMSKGSRHLVIMIDFWFSIKRSKKEKSRRGPSANGTCQVQRYSDWNSWNVKNYFWR